MSDLIGICGQVRGLEPRLLNVNRLDRMVGAVDAEAAFSVLSELQYSDYLDQETEVTDFDRIIGQGLFETKELLQSGLNDHPGMDFLWLQSDLNNLKRALKQKLVENKTSLSDFGTDEGFSKLGNLTETDLNQIVFEKRPSGSIPYQLIESVNRAEDIFNKTEDFRFVEYDMDEAYFHHLKAVAQESGDDFLQELCTMLANINQVRTIARSVLVNREAVPPEGHLPYGHFARDKASKIETFEELARQARMTELGRIFDEIEESDSDSEKLVKLERGLDHYYQDWLNREATGSIDSIAVLINYFERRMRNAQLIKFVMYAKFHGLDTDTIYKRLEHF